MIEIQDSLRKSRFSLKIEIFAENLEIFVEHRNFRRNSRFSPKLFEIFVEIPDFRRKSTFSTKIEIFVEIRDFHGNFDFVVDFVVVIVVAVVAVVVVVVDVDKNVDKNVDDKANGARGRGVVAPSQTSTSGRASMKTPATTRGGGGAPDLSVSGNGGGRRGDGGGGGAGVKNTHPQSTLDLGAGDLNDLAEVIRRDIHWGNPNVPWESVAGLDDAKRLLKEAVVMPVRYPDLFRGLLSPWRGVLLYGPPGTGKTMLAKAVATECDTTFFNVSSSTVVSKWRGDSEKLVRVLFELANFHAPSTVFIDEIDALMSARGGGGGGGGEHEASRRMKTELLIQMDGLASPDTANGVFVLCATNLPWELDLAMLRRLEKRVLVGLPNEDARAAMTTNLLGPHKRDAAVSLGWVAKETEGYSGSDVATLCKEMAMRPLRRLMERLEGEGRRAPRAAPPSVGSITEEDARAAMEVTKPSAVLHLSRYEDWCAQFGDHRH